MNPSAKQASTKGAHVFFLGNVWHVYQLSRHGNPVNIISFERHSLFNFHIKDKYWNWSQKARNQILDTSISPCPSSVPANKTCVPNLEISTSLQNWRQKTCTNVYLLGTVLKCLPLSYLLKVNPEQSLLQIKVTLKLIPKKATKSWKLTPRLVQSLPLKLGGEAWK